MVHLKMKPLSSFICTHVIPKHRKRYKTFSENSSLNIFPWRTSVLIVLYKQKKKKKYSWNIFLVHSNCVPIVNNGQTFYLLVSYLFKSHFVVTNKEFGIMKEEMF